MKPPKGWTARLLALVAGLAAGFAHPPFGLLPGLLGYALFLSLLDTSGPHPWRSAFFRGWLVGVGYFAVCVWWITEPFMVDAREQGWMAPFALVLMAGGLALFWGGAALAYRRLRARGVAGAVVFAGCLAGFEWLRGHVLTGLPWDLPGETWRAGSAPSQAAAMVGAYGLTWITVAIASAPGAPAAGDVRRRRAAALAFTATGLVALYGFGALRLSHAAPPDPSAPMIRVVQANIDQKVKWRPENLEQIFQTYIDLTDRPARAAPQVVIWPEGALPVVIDDFLGPGSSYVRRLRAALEPGQTLIMGANRAEAGPAGSLLYFNSLIALRRDPDALRVSGVYDKHQLVPFGEYMPLGDIASKVGFRSLVHMADDFTAGQPPRPLAPQGLPAFQPLICYEALFPGFTRNAVLRAGLRPAWILNISNDAWFGLASGPWQHLNIASYRALEEGLPIIRATPTGVSAVIDAYGRIVPGARIGLGGMGVIDTPLPRALPPTLYHRHGELYFAMMVFLSLMAALAYRIP